MINRITLLEFSNSGNSLIPKIPVKNKALYKNYVEEIYLNNLFIDNLRNFLIKFSPETEIICKGGCTRFK